jgi:hypothetical protein
VINGVLVAPVALLVNIVVWKKKECLVIADHIGPKFQHTKREWEESKILCWASISSKGFQTADDDAHNFLKFLTRQL